MDDPVLSVIRSRRKAANLSQAVMAEKLGDLTASGWSRIESGQTGLTLPRLRQVARVFGLQPWQILAEADDVERSIPTVATSGDID